MAFGLAVFFCPALCSLLALVLLVLQFACTLLLVPGAAKLKSVYFFAASFLTYVKFNRLCFAVLL